MNLDNVLKFLRPKACTYQILKQSDSQCEQPDGYHVNGCTSTTQADAGIGPGNVSR